MQFRSSTILVAAFLCLTPIVSVAQLSPYSQDFEGMVMESPVALGNDGWLVFGSVYDGVTGDLLYGYGSFPAPNSTASGTNDAFCGLSEMQGGPSQGDQQLNVFSDYENGDHANGNLVESNVYQERTILSGDVGSTWFFEFDAKRGNLVSPTTAVAFIKTLDPGAGFATTNFIQINMTYADTIWWRYAASITIDSGLVDQRLQFGFASTATDYTDSGMFYDNVDFTQTASLDVPQGPTPGSGVQLRVLGNPAIGNAAQVLSFTTPRNSHVTARVYDVGGRLVTTLIDQELGAGPHQVKWQGRHATGQKTVPGIYFAEVVAGTERAVAKLIRSR